MSNETLHHLAIVSIVSIKCTQSGNVRRSSSTHEMILLCSSCRVSGDAFLSFLGSGFSHLFSFWKIGLAPTYGLKHATACHSTAKFSRGPLVPGAGVAGGCCSFLQLAVEVG